MTMSKRAAPVKQFPAKPGRLAFICEHKDHDGVNAPLRIFVTPTAAVPECPKHGKMTLQANRPYRGQPIPTRAA